MKHTEKTHILDGGYWFDPCETVCKTCKHMISFWDYTCAAYPGKIPPEYWNRVKKCPKMEKRTDSDEKAHN